MLIADIFHSPLDGLYLCPECNHAGNCAGRCPGCSNMLGLLNLARVLNRAEPRQGLCPGGIALNAGWWDRAINPFDHPRLLVPTKRKRA